MTQMSCPAGMEIEGEFLRALAQVERWKISGPELELLDGIGEPVARFAAPSPDCVMRPSHQIEAAEH
jgi:heat shock protein HslJ